MRVGIMQPYFMPYIGYFQLISSVDRFILFDDVQYIRHGWINRNRILKPEEGWQYIIAPLEQHNRDSLIKDIRVLSDDAWKKKILAQLTHYKKKSSQYKEVISLVEKCLFGTDEKSITSFNGYVLKTICDHLEIPFIIEISSSIGFDYSQVEGAGDWALRISEQVGATEYINPASGEALFNKQSFESLGIKLSMLHPIISSYSQRRESFEPGLSIIDVLMFNDLETVKSYLKHE